MKLPRLGNPTTTVIEESTFMGPRVRTEITQASQFDLMTTNQQWAFILFMTIPFIAAIFLFFLSGNK